MANVAVGVTFPKVTFVQRRESRSTGNTRDVRVIKEVEIPPNDAVILVDGRLVLEKTPKVVDRIYVEGKQQNVGIITNVSYDEPSGIATVFTKEAHGFSANDPITLAGIAFTCSGSTGITTTIFPDPMQSYTVDLVNGTKFTCSKDSHGSNHPYPRSTDPASGKLLTVTAVSGTATFTVNVGASSPSDQYTHTFVSGVANAIKKVNTRFNVLESQYNGGPNPKEVIFEGNPLTLNVGEVALSLNVNHNLSGGNKIRIVDNSLIYTCSMDNRATEHSYPRSTDPASNVELQISTTGTKSFRCNVGASASGGFFAPLEMELIASVLENSTA